MVNRIIFTLLFIITSLYIIIWIKDLVTHKIEKGRVIPLTLTALITNFFDTLGIGSFAPSLAIISTFRLSDEKTLPGTLNIGLTLPVVIEAFIFIKGIEVDSITLTSLIASATLGSILGAMFISSLNEYRIKRIIGFALIIMALIMVLGELKVFSFGGYAIGLEGIKLAIAIISNFILGALMTAGVGLYAPCMFMISALGMNPKIAFPIMMGSCAFLMPAASIKFIENGSYDRGASLIISVFGVIGVLLGSKIVTSLSIEFMKYVVIFVVIYGGVATLRKVKRYV